MRFGVLAILGVTLLMAVMVLAMAVGGTLFGGGTSDIAGVPGSGSIFEIQVGPDSCLRIGFDPDDTSSYCLEDVEAELPPEMIGTVAREPADSP
ncbi:MAG: hypothetical protein QGG09_18115 [Pirellulaceae bacterium]|nr:hypothetical protein [Pirellulaceae bacterium]